MTSYQLTLTLPDQSPVRRVVGADGLHRALADLAGGSLPADADLYVAEVSGGRRLRSLAA